MPVVPFTPAAAGGPKPKPIPDVDDPWLLMAAATMDAQGRLVADEETEEDTPRDG